MGTISSLTGLLDFAGAGGSGHTSGVYHWIFIVFCVAILLLTARSWLRSGKTGGKGPAVNWFPRFMRPSVNSYWLSRGWPPPYDDDLNKIPRSER